MAPIIIVSVLFIAVFGGMIFLAVRKIKETDPSNVDTSIKSTVDTAQEFLPFEDVRDNCIHLGNHQYRAIIKCSSIPYSLKTENEQDIVEMSYQRFLNSLNHPISIFIETRTMDNTKMLESLSKDIDKVKDAFPDLSNYADMFYDSMSGLYDSIGNNKEKNKYIIVPYDEAIKLTNSTEEEKYTESLKELQSRCQIIADGLSSVGVNCEILNTGKIIELLYAIYHKDTANQAENILSGDYLSLIVNGDNKLSDISDEGRLDFIIYETQVRLQTELNNENGVSPEIKEKTSKVINILEKTRKELAGYYQADLHDNEDEITFFK